MSEMRSVSLPSGATLQIGVAPFAVAKNLHQALLRELSSVQIQGEMDLVSVWKDLFCLGFSSKHIDAAMTPCLARCLYNGAKIDDQTFEPVANRDDYMTVLMEVAKENVLPFAKSLFAEWKLRVSIEKTASHAQGPTSQTQPST